MYIPVEPGHTNLDRLNDSPFRIGSSEVDWCEPNFVVSAHIAEFWNTVSNVFFFLVPPMTIALFGSFSKRVGNGMTVLWLLLIVIGIGSVYFHATLSFAGQLLDEICILWVLMAGYTLFLPAVLTPQSFRMQRLLYMWGLNNRLRQHRYVYSCVAFTIIITGLSVVYPYANAFALIILGLPAIVFLSDHVSKCDNRRIRNLGIHCLCMCAAALTVWLCDRTLCSFWISISFPYLHAIWHVLILFSANEAIVVCAYLLIKQQFPHANLVLHTWPNEQWGYFTLPYLKFHDDGNYLAVPSNNFATKSIV